MKATGERGPAATNENEAMFKPGIRSGLFILLVCLSGKPAFSQDVDLLVKGIEEKRYADDRQSLLQLTATIEGLQLDADHLIRIKEITNAEDDKGNTLNELEGSFFGNGYDRFENITITLAPPRREASKIKTLEGVFQYFTLSGELKSKVVVHNFNDRRYKNLLAGIHPRVKLILMDTSSVKDSAEIERLHKEAGIGKSLEEAQQFFSNMQWNSPLSQGLYFYMEDPGDELYKIIAYDGKGEKLDPTYSWGGNRYQLSFAEKPAPDWRLEILVQNENTVKELKFKLQDIDLP